MRERKSTIESNVIDCLVSSYFWFYLC